MNKNTQAVPVPFEQNEYEDLDSESRDEDTDYESLLALRRSEGERSEPLNRYRLDKLECAIIGQLNEDGRKPYQAIARELGVDEKTVRNRVNKLRERGILNFIPTTDANALKGCIVAIVAVSISTDVRHNVERLARAIADMPMVSWVGTVMGQFDLLVEVIVDSWDALAQFTLTELPAIPGIGKTDSFLVLSHYGKRGMPFVERILSPRK